MKTLKDCIAFEMREEDVCSIQHQNALLAAIDPLVSVACGTLSRCPAMFEVRTLNSTISLAILKFCISIEAD